MLKFFSLLFAIVIFIFNFLRADEDSNSITLEQIKNNNQYMTAIIHILIIFLKKLRSKSRSLTLALLTGSQLELMALCSLKVPSNVSAMSCILNAHTALPDILFGGVVKVPYISWAFSPPYTPSINSVVDSVRQTDFFLTLLSSLLRSL